VCDGTGANQLKFTTMKIVSKKNYWETLEEIREKYDLKEVTTVNNQNGYPSGIWTMLKDFKKEEQAAEIAREYSQAQFFEISWRDGWNTAYRRNHLHGAPEAYTAWDMAKLEGVDYLFSKSQIKDCEEYLAQNCESYAYEIINDFEHEDKTLTIKEDPTISDCEEFYSKANELAEYIDEEEDGCPLYIWNDLNALAAEIKNSKDILEEVKKIKDTELFGFDNDGYLHVFPEKSMVASDGDVTTYAIAVGFGYWDLDEEEDEEEGEEE
jgi:hypothetical protein